MPITKVKDLEVYRVSFQLALDIFELSKFFPNEEKYSLTDQIRRSSRSVSANITEGFGKRVYAAEFKRHLIYGLGSIEETKTWLEFANAHDYMKDKDFERLFSKAEEVGAKLFRLYENWS